MDLRLLLQGLRGTLEPRERGLERISAAYPPSFYMHLKDPNAHWEMIQALESRFRVEECSFNSIFGTFEGHRIYASRKVAEKIEIQTRYAAELYNVDVRQDQRYLAEKDLFPCGERDESRFSPDFEIPLSILGMEVAGDPNFPREISCVQVLVDRKQRFEGSEKVVLADLLEFIKVHDPDVVLFTHADTWSLSLSRRPDATALSRRSSALAVQANCLRSYWSYGKDNHKDESLLIHQWLNKHLIIHKKTASPESPLEAREANSLAEHYTYSHVLPMLDIKLKVLAISGRTSSIPQAMAGRQVEYGSWSKPKDMEKTWKAYRPCACWQGIWHGFLQGSWYKGWSEIPIER